MLTDMNNNSEKKMNHANNSEKKKKDKCKIICNHDFISDYIDLTPERSQIIIYCTKCFITKE